MLVVFNSGTEFVLMFNKIVPLIISLLTCTVYVLEVLIMMMRQRGKSTWFLRKFRL